MGLPWVQDAISAVEYDTIDWLENLGYEDVPNLAAIIAMPFLQTPDTTDVLALQSMRRLAHEEALDPLIEHASFLDGITDNETTFWSPQWVRFIEIPMNSAACWTLDTPPSRP